MKGQWRLTKGTLYDFLSLGFVNRLDIVARKNMSLSHKFYMVMNYIGWSFLNAKVPIDAHYTEYMDELYEVMLGKYMVYSCGYIKRFPGVKLLYGNNEDKKVNKSEDGKKSPKKKSSSSAPTFPINTTLEGVINQASFEPSFCRFPAHPFDLLEDGELCEGPDTRLKLDLDEMQKDKMELICRKLQLAPGMTLLDIGCGCGGLCIYAAEHFGCQTLGFALTPRMLDLAKSNANKFGVGHLCEFWFGNQEDVLKKLAVEGRKFDRVVSVGVFEHILHHQYKLLFNQLSKILKPTAIGLIHAINSPRKPNVSDPFVQKYIFPNSTNMMTSLIIENLERLSMPVVDVENIKQHYIYTLRCWWERSQKHFKNNKNNSKYPEHFQRLWEWYMHACMAFGAHGAGSLHQILFYASAYNGTPLHRQALIM